MNLLVPALLLALPTAPAQGGAPSAAAAALRRAERPPVELRGAWLGDAQVLSSRARIAEAMDLLAASGFNAVFPLVWRDGLTLWPSETLRKACGVSIDSAYAGRDVLAECVLEGHRAGLEVLPWFEGGFSAGARGRTSALLEAHPDWAALDAAGAPLAKAGQQWLDALDTRVQDFMSELVLEACRNYDVDGIQADERLPALPSEAACKPLLAARYRAEFHSEPPRDSSEPAWLRWRAGILSEFLDRLRGEMRAVDASLVLAVAPGLQEWSLREYLQDPQRWQAQKSADWITPQTYRRDLAAYEPIIAKLNGGQFTPAQLQRFSPGLLVKVGPRSIQPRFLLDAIAFQRAQGLPGEVLFLHEALVANEGELVRLLRKGPYASAAMPPWRARFPWRPRAMVFPALIEESEGDWEALDESADVFRLQGGRQGAFSYLIQQPHDAVYDLHAWVPGNQDRTGRATYLLQGARERAWVELDPSRAREAGWMRLGTLALAGEQIIEPLKLVATELDGARATYAGPLLLLLNRRLSPGLDW